MAGNPDLIFLDEPTVGLDIASRKLFWHTIDELKAQGKTIIFTTHYLQEADDVADRIILFNHGTIIEDGTPVEIKAKLSKQSVSFVESEEISMKELKQLPHVLDVYKRKDRIFVVTDHTDEVIAALQNRLYR